MKLKRLGVGFLVCLLLMTGGMVSFAEEMVVETNGVIVPYYTYVSSVGAGLSIERDGYATCSGSIVVYGNRNGELTITLQRSTNGKTWTNVKSWTDSFYGDYHIMEEGYYVTSGYTYRVMTTGKVKSGSTTLETVTAYSPTDSY